MVILDATITNIALPVDRQRAGLGGLMLLGGKAGDLFGRRRIFQAGIGVFTLASLLGGLAPKEGLLIGARILQGIGAALGAQIDATPSPSTRKLLKRLQR
jgi:MFS family permease